MLRSKSLLLMADTVLPEYIYYAFTYVVIFYLYMHVYKSYCVHVRMCLYLHVVHEGIYSVHVVQLNTLNILDLILIPVLGRYHFSAIINACRSIRLIKIFKYTRCMYINVHVHVHLLIFTYACTYITYIHVLTHSLNMCIVYFRTSTCTCMHVGNRKGKIQYHACLFTLPCDA